jgi:hypothetical protein
MISAPLSQPISKTACTFPFQAWSNLPEGGQREPEKEDKLEDKVERKPVNNVDEALHDSEEREHDPILQK